MEELPFYWLKQMKIKKNADQVVRKLIKREELNAAEKSMVEEMNICFLYFDADKKLLLKKRIMLL